MDCPSCAKTIEKKLPDGKIILTAEVNFAAKSAIIEFDENKISPEKIIKKLNLLGFEVKEKPQTSEKKPYYYIVFTLIPALIVLQQVLAPHETHIHAVRVMPIAAFAIVFAYNTFKKAFLSVKRGDITAELYMSLGILVTFFAGEFVSSAVIVFYQNIGEYLDEVTSRRAASTIQALIDLSPEEARVIKGNEEITVSAKDVRIDDIVLVRSGEKIPVDGIVTDGNGFVNQSAITGESAAQEKIKAMEVFAGTILESGFLKIQAQKTYENTVFYKIITLIEEAEKHKSAIQKIADKFAVYFLPALLVISIAVYLITKNLNSAIAVIIVACPCAIAVATPIAIMASAGKLAKHGIIIKGGLSLEVLSKVNALIMDKTGTLTLGEPKVASLKGFGCHEDADILSNAAACEAYSEHHLAKAILKKAKDLNLTLRYPDKFTVVPGKGVIAEIKNEEIMMGNKFLMENIPISADELEYINNIEKAGQTSILIAHNKELCGVMGISDTVRDEVKEALLDLKREGIKEMIMVTGDNKSAASSVAKKLNITRVFADELPEDKVNTVRAIQKENKIVAFVGDGINDAPALKTADLSIAMGAAGTYVAIETADIVLMNDNLLLLPLAIKQGRRTAKTIKQNILFGLAFNILGVAAASMGLLPPVWAAMAHIVPDVFVFANSARLIK